MGIQREERSLTFARIERKTPMLRPELQSNQSFLCSLHHSRDRGGGGPNAQIVSIIKAADRRRQKSMNIVDEMREKYSVTNKEICLVRIVSYLCKVLCHLFARLLIEKKGPFFPRKWSAVVRLYYVTIVITT